MLRLELSFVNNSGSEETSFAHASSPSGRVKTDFACPYNLMEKDETLRREYPGPRRLVRQLLEETQQGDLFTWAEKHDRINEFFAAINELAVVMEGEIAPSDAPKSSDPNTPVLKAMIGKRSL